jgi:hypothetical protein
MEMESLLEFAPPPHNSKVLIPFFSTPSLARMIH